MKTFKALSALLSYPSEELQAAIPAIREVLDSEGLVPADLRRGMEPLLSAMAGDDIYALQERYVLLFDRSRTLSLNLFEHIHGESRDRGGAMVDLMETYRAGGFDLHGPELPDHLPVLLEFLANRPLPEAREILADAGPIIAVLAERLARRETDYAPVMATLAALANAASDSPESAAMLDVPDDDPEDLEALDAVYQEAQVTFAPDPNAGCPISRDILAKMDVPMTPARAGTAQ